MGEEKKDVDKNDGKEDIKKDEKKPEDLPVVLQVDMHCVGCARKVKKSLMEFTGVEDVQIDMMSNKVTVKGKVDPLKICERVQKKTKRKTKLLSPLPQKSADEKNPEDQNPEKKAEPQKNDDKVWFFNWNGCVNMYWFPTFSASNSHQSSPCLQPLETTVVLIVSMHCEGCAQAVKKNILKMKGVQTAEPDFPNQRVTVRGTMDPKKLVRHLYKRTGKHAHILPQKVDKEKEDTGEQKDAGEKKDAGEQKDAGEKSQQEEKKDDEKKEEGQKKEEEKKDADEKKEEADKTGGEDKKDGEKKDGEEKKDGDQEKKSVKEEEEKKEGDNETKAIDDAKKHECYAPIYVIEYVHPPQLFSDENPNACSIM